MPKASKAEGSGSSQAASPIKPVQRRSALACLPCRSAKNKCDGQAPPLAVEISASQARKAAPSDDIPSELPCTRCKRLDLRCLWQPSHRTGRPRKKPRVSDAYQDTVSPGAASTGGSCIDATPTPTPSAGAAPSSEAAAAVGASAAVDITGPELFALLNASPYDSTESSYSTLEADPYENAEAAALDPSLDDTVAALSATFDLPTTDSDVAAWSAEVPSTAGLPASASSSSQQPQQNNVYEADEASSPCDRPSKRACAQFSILRSRIGVGARQDRAMEFANQPSTPWGELDFPELQGQESNLRRGLRLFFSGFGLSVPILGAEENFFAARFVDMPELSPSPLVLHAAATLGLLVEDGKASPAVAEVRARTRELADITVENASALFDTDLARVLSAVQGLILVAYDDYGRTQIPSASRYMRAACDLAMRAQLNLLDTGRMDWSINGSDSYGLARKPVSFAGIGASSEFTPEFFEDCRRTWWELYIADLMFHMTTSGKLQRVLTDRNMVTAVNSPKDPGDTEHSEAYNIRIRAAALINECTRPPSDPRNPDLGRLHAVDTMLSNLLLRGQSLWAGIAANVSSSRARPLPVVQTKLEIIFTALVVLQAARIHLHRQAWFSDLQMDLESCSFKPKPGAIERAPASHGGSGALGISMISDDARRDYVASSVSTIVSCADGILRLIRLDAEMHLDLATATAPTELDAPPPKFGLVPPHWPFFACCSMVASFGYAVAVAASGPEYSALPSYRDEIRLRMGDGRSYGTHGGAGGGGAGSDVDYSISGAENPTMDSIVANWCQQAPGPSGATSQSQASASVGSSAPSSSLVAGGGDGGGLAASTSVQQYELAQEQRRRDEEAYIWKTRMALSNIEFAESTLGVYTTVWDMAAMYAAEVRRCKAAVDMGGLQRLAGSSSW